MCGIVGLVRKPRELTPDTLNGLEELLVDIQGQVVSANSDTRAQLTDFAKRSISLDAAITLVKNKTTTARISELAEQVRGEVEKALAEKDLSESDKNALLTINDALWRISRDACASANEIADLLSQQCHDMSNLTNDVIAIYRSINLVLRSVDRIEVRGRDSAGISVGLDHIALDDDDMKALSKRSSSHFANGSVRFTDKGKDSQVYFVYKRAAEIGELGDNVAFLRNAITHDELLFDVITRNEQSHEMVMAHTRWASMGVISEDNTHPLDCAERNKANVRVTLGALNGDIDNHIALKTECAIEDSITTDAKLIPVLVDHERNENPSTDAFDSCRKVVSRFEGSTAVSIMTSDDPSKMYLALRGGGQGLFIGLGNDEFFIASEPYGVVEVADSYVRVDGETPFDPEQPVASRGQIFCLDSERAGSLEGLRRSSYLGDEIVLTADDVITSEVTTRDIDRGDYDHYLWKEINEAPRSFSTTLHGKFSRNDSNYDVELHDDIISPAMREAISSGEISRVYIIGQGTAAVAGQACGHFFSALKSTLDVRVCLATELSGFALEDDMSGSLVIAVSQSGTTTDTNRTVDLLRDRGARVIAIVNRRGSDLTTKADGVCYTSSGRDVEMSVASTKAFYAQVAAGAYLAIAIETIRSSQTLDRELVNDIVSALHEIPSHMKTVLQQRSEIEAIAQSTVLSRRSWATVGNGSNAIAAREIRIKSSELCYKAIAMDATEDKKHIDLSSEPLIVVCATGIQGSNADDVAKEVAIYSAHKACPVVINDDESERFDSCNSVILVPKTHKDVSFILATVAGHIFGYESARAIDASARVLREARGALATITPEQLGSVQALTYIGNVLSEPAQHYFAALSDRKFDAILDASDAGDLTKLFVALTPPYMTSLVADKCGGLQTPQALTNCAVSMLTRAIDQLTRPIDAIRHQAKTVTVGISRSDDTLLRSACVSYLLESGVQRDVLSFPVIRTLIALDEMVGTITGHTRYLIHGDPTSTSATLEIAEQKGSAEALVSRIAQNPTLRGTKRLTAREQVVWITQGKSDSRNVIMIPEVTRSITTGITLLHIDVVDNDELSVDARKRVLEGYKQKLFALRDAVTETQDTFDESILADIDMMELLTQPVVVLASKWNQ